MAEYIIEHLKCETELLKLTALAALAIGSGTVGLMLGEPTVLRLIFAGAGFLVTVGCLVALWRLRRSLRASIATLKQEDEP